MMETVEHIVQQPAKRTHQTPLFFQHGAWHGAWCWQRWMDYFTSLGYETHAISLPGHGKSSLQKRYINFYTFRDYVETLADQIEVVSPRPVVIGHSLGGAILQKYLERHQLPGAVLLATLPSTGMTPMIWRLLKRRPISTLSGMLKFNSYDWIGTPELAQDLFLHPKTEIDTVAFHKQLVNETAELAFSLMFPFAKVNSLKTPVFVVSAEKDVVFTVQEQKRTSRKYGAKSVLIEDQPHNLMMESAWKQVAELIDDWITNEVKLP